MTSVPIHLRFPSFTLAIIDIQSALLFQSPGMKISSFRRVLKGSSFTFGQGPLHTVGWKVRSSISDFKRVSSEKSFTSTFNVKYLPRDTPPDFHRWEILVLQAVCIVFEDSVIAITLRLGYKGSKKFKLIGFIWVFA